MNTAVKRFVLAAVLAGCGSAWAQVTATIDCTTKTVTLNVTSPYSLTSGTTSVTESDAAGRPVGASIATFTNTGQGAYRITYRQVSSALPYVSVSVVWISAGYSLPVGSTSYTTCLSASCGADPDTATVNTPFSHQLTYSPSPATVSWRLASDTSNQLRIDPVTGVVSATFTSVPSQNPVTYTATVTFLPNSELSVSRTTPVCQIVVKVPTQVDTVAPPLATACGPDFDITIRGSSFPSGSTVRFQSKSAGVDRSLTPKSLSLTQIVVTVPRELIVNAGSDYSITIVPPVPDTGVAQPIGPYPFTVRPTPQIGSISPSPLAPGTPNATLTVTGTNLVPGTTHLLWNSGSSSQSPIPPRAGGSATELVFALPANLIASPAQVPLTLLNIEDANPRQTPYTCAKVTTLPVSTGLPTISQLTPAAATACGPAFSLTIAGTNFATGAQILFDGNTVTATSLSAAQIQTAVSAAFLGTSARQATVSVANQTATNQYGTPATATFPVAAAPSVTDISPKIAAGTGQQTLTVTGSGFVTGRTKIVWTSGTTSQTYDGNVSSPTTLTITVPAAALAVGSRFAAVVADAANPNGSQGPSTAGCPTPYTISTGPPVGSLDPSSEFAGRMTNLTVTVNGSGYVSNSQVLVNGTAASTTYVSAQQLRVVLTPSMLAQAGTLQISVQNPGGTPGASSPFSVRTVAAQPYQVTSTGGGSASPGATVPITVSQTGTPPASLDFTLKVSFEPAADNIPATGLSAKAAPVFGNGQTTYTFTSSQGSITVPAAGNVKAPSVAGTVVITLDKLVITGTTQSVLPANLTPLRITVGRARPVIDSGGVTLTSTATGVMVTTLACTTPRNIDRATYVFETAAGTNVSGSLTIQLPDAKTAFDSWFSSSGGNDAGGCFSFAMPFTVSNGSSASINAVTVTLHNTEGDSNGVRASR